MRNLLRAIRLPMWAGGLALLFASPAMAQTGAIHGRVTDSRNDAPIEGAEVRVAGTQYGTLTDSDGRFRIRSLRPGTYTVSFRAIGYRLQLRDSVDVTSTLEIQLLVQLFSDAIQLPEIQAQVGADRLLDPKVTETVQSITAQDLRELPVASIADALVLQAGVVEGSYRGGRAGQESFVVDGLGVKNRLDASTGETGINLPPIALEEVTLITNGFSARYGQALSGIITVTTRDGGDELEGSVAYETDRPFPNGWDVGLDRVTGSVGGPLIGSSRFFLSADLQARVDDDPVAAPPPTRPFGSEPTLDPRVDSPWLLPHNSGERYDVLGKLTIPVFGRSTIRLLGLGSEQRRLRFDRALKYSPTAGPAESTSGRLGMFHWQTTSSPRSLNTTVLDVRLGYFEKEALRSVLLNDPNRVFGAFTFGDFDFAGERIATTSDSAAALGRIDGFVPPAFADSPWGVPAFFMTEDPRGGLTHNRFREMRAQLDLLLGRGLDTDFRIGGEFVRQSVRTFTRLEAYRSVAAGAPAPRVSSFEPFSTAGYAEVQQRVDELSLTAGVRVDGFDARSGAESGALSTKWAVSPRIALSTELHNATVVASFGRFAQAPDFQYLVDAAFDDTLRTGRFRRGNPALGFETSWQYEFSVRLRPVYGTGVKVGAYFKRLDGLISSVPIGFNPDSSVFANADYGTVRGIEITVNRDFIKHFGARVTYVLQQASATATDAFDFFRRLNISTLGDTVVPASIEIPLDFDRRHSFIAVLRGSMPGSVGRPFKNIEGALVARYSSGLPYSRTNIAGDTILGLPNDQRLPSQFSLDMLLRKTMRLRGRSTIGFYVDVRNLTNRRNVIAVRRDTGEPGPGQPQTFALAQQAFNSHPEGIPWESPRYIPFFDTDQDGIIAGGELLNLYQRAAADFLQPLFQYGTPRLVRFGIEVGF